MNLVKEPPLDANSNDQRPQPEWVISQPEAI